MRPSQGVQWTWKDAHLDELDGDGRLADATAADDDHFVGLRLSVGHVESGALRVGQRRDHLAKHMPLNRASQVTPGTFSVGLEFARLDLGHADFIKQMLRMRLIAILASPNQQKFTDGFELWALLSSLSLFSQGMEERKNIYCFPSTPLPAASLLGWGADGAATSWFGLLNFLLRNPKTICVLCAPPPPPSIKISCTTRVPLKRIIFFIDMLVALLLLF